MKSTFVSALLASSLFLGCQAKTADHDFDNYERASRRSLDMVDKTPFTKDEMDFYRKMVDEGRFSILKDGPKKSRSKTLNVVKRRVLKSTKAGALESTHTTSTAKSKSAKASTATATTASTTALLSTSSLLSTRAADDDDFVLPDEFDVGTKYIWNNEPLFAVGTNSTNSTSGRYVEETDQFATVSGKCTRTDPHDELDEDNYVGRAYCQFEYDFFDVLGVIQLNAEGPVRIGETGVLAVTGGTSIYRRTVGEIRLTPVDPEFLVSSPPDLEASFEQDLPASYFVEAYLYIDVNLLFFGFFG
eukprot:Nitzschia sp. Nitz4//scaffold71_size96697//68749//69978//NITZ4_004703-RA/size96697-augustus-gene-0.147-mRNA-1//1//CDS//3329557271//5515//frame0